MSQRTPFVVEPFTDACRSILERREHIIFGVSPGNSYFRVELLSDLLGWLCENTARVDVVIPDSGLEHTYRALGYDPRRAAKKVRGETNVLRNRVLRAWANWNGPRESDGIHMMSSLADNRVYQDLLTDCEKAVNHDHGLRETCAAMSREVLLSRGHRGEPEPERIEQGMRYLIAELPFFLAGVDIFDVPSSLCFYHQKLPLADLIFSGGSTLKPSPRQGYAVIRPENYPSG